MKNLALRAHLTTLYGEPQRHYHNLSHVQHCLREYKTLMEDEHAPTPTPPEQLAIEYAIWFHDCVYDPKAPHGENERESAELAWTYLHENVWRDGALPVSDMILATGNHFGLNIKEEYSLATKYFLDIDLSILGTKSDALYTEYATNIRKEYLFVDREDYIKARMKILASFLAKPRIFQTDYFHNKYETIARQNIQWEMHTVSFCL